MPVQLMQAELEHDRAERDEHGRRHQGEHGRAGPALAPRAVHRQRESGGLIEGLGPSHHISAVGDDIRSVGHHHAEHLLS